MTGVADVGETLVVEVLGGTVDPSLWMVVLVVAGSVLVSPPIEVDVVAGAVVLVVVVAGSVVDVVVGATVVDVVVGASVVLVVVGATVVLVVVGATVVLVVVGASVVVVVDALQLEPTTTDVVFVVEMCAAGQVAVTVRTIVPVVEPGTCVIACVLPLGATVEAHPATGTDVEPSVAETESTCIVSVGPDSLLPIVQVTTWVPSLQFTTPERTGWQAAAGRARKTTHPIAMTAKTAERRLHPLEPRNARTRPPKPLPLTRMPPTRRLRACPLLHQIRLKTPPPGT